MRFLVVEDDFTSRRLLQKMLAPFGDCDIAVNGEEAIEAFRLALNEGNNYNVVCLDIMMPEMDGQQVLKEFRTMERELEFRPDDEVKVIMTTALDSPKDVIEAYYRGGCTDYMVKPIEKRKLHELLAQYGIYPKAG